MKSDSADLNQILEVSRGACAAVGQYLADRFLEGWSIEIKRTRHDVILAEDQEAERIFTEHVRSYFPEARIFAEGYSRKGAEPKSYWLLDPLDGTNNFACGIPYFSVCVSYIQDDRTELAIVLNPLLKDCYWAVRGRGAFLNGRRLGTSSSRSRSLASSTIALASGHSVYKISSLSEIAANLEASLRDVSKRVTTFWAPSLDWSLLAAGKLDGVISFASEEEELRAGLLIAEEAGAGTWVRSVTSGKRIPQQVFVSSRHLLRELADVVQACLPKA